MQTQTDDLFIDEEHELDEEVRELDPEQPDVPGAAQQVVTRARAWVFEHPMAALGIAIASGFLVGRLVRWR